MLKKLLITTFFTNWISGFQFLIILNYFSAKDSTIEALKYSALALLFNRIGRLVAVTTSLWNADIFKKYDHLIYSFVFVISIILQHFNYDFNFILSSFLLGIGMSGTTIAQRWRITDVVDTRANLYYSILSISGWGIGIVLPSIFIYYKFQLINIPLQILLMFPIIYYSIFVANYLDEKTQLRSKTSDIKKSVVLDLRSEKTKYIYIFFSALIVACTASIFNGTLISLLKNTYNLNDLQISLSFLLNLMGSLVLFLRPTFFENRNSIIWLAISNIIFIVLTYLIMFNLNTTVLLLSVLLIGTIITLSSTFQLEIIATLNPYRMSIRRIHVLAELSAIFGGAVVYIMSIANYDSKTQLLVLSFVATLMLFLSMRNENKETSRPYKMRLACKEDLEFIVKLYDECEDPTIGQGKFPESRKRFFTGNQCVEIPLDPPIDGFTLLVYYIIEDYRSNKVGCITNLRNDKNHEEIGMLLNSMNRGKGLGSTALLYAVGIRKQFAKKITGIIAESNIACVKASLNAGAKVLSKSNYQGYTQNFLNVEFFNRGDL